MIDRTPEGEDYDRIRRRVLWTIPSGLYLVGSRSGSIRNLMTLSWASQVATDPKLVGIGVEASSVTHRLIVEGGSFSLALLRREDRALVRKFVKPVTDVEVDEVSGRGTMNTVRVLTALTGSPIPEQAAAWVDCEVRTSLSLGSHTWFVGEVVDVGLGSPDADILRMEDTRMSYGG